MCDIEFFVCQSAIKKTAPIASAQILFRVTVQLISPRTPRTDQDTKYNVPFPRDAG